MNLELTSMLMFLALSACAFRRVPLTFTVLEVAS
jgi:hypothetical protein